ncbi:MAG: Gfo/Idh/MocA family oxidoreductase [Pseudomonadota bacterium]|nr:Gfo/Idh/MocA family oxidoreductase [Pseudomonadota bacterium]
MSLRIGIAGCGAHAMGRIVPLLLAEDTEFELAAAWTRKPQTQQQLRTLGIKDVYGDFDRFLAADVDVVYIASPTGCHAEHAAAVLNAGRHAWVEKPLATNLADTRELVALAERNGRMLAEGFMFAWHPQAAAIKEALARDVLGAPRLATSTFCFPHLQPDNIRYDPALGGGAWLDHACYLVKALDLYFPGDWHLLGGCLDNDGYAVDVRGAAQLRRMQDGMIAQLGWGFGHSYVNEMQVVGAHGRMLVDSAFTKPASRSCDVTLEDSKGECSTILVPADNAFARMFAALRHQLGNPASWAALRHDILAHAERFFALQTQLQNVSSHRAGKS